MRCPTCFADMPPNQLYCTVCGSEMDLTFDKVTKATTLEIDREEVAATTLSMQKLATVALVALIIAGVVYFAYRARPTGYAVPIYPHDSTDTPLAEPVKKEFERPHPATLTPFEEKEYLVPLRRPYG
ncbi:MAG: hypothetical protein HY719_02480 [Planctomycetes bacterium]|nr:hypothetical protein [Planctomycetota bacterium]